MFKQIVFVCLLFVQIGTILTQNSSANKCNLQSHTDRENKYLNVLSNLNISKQFVVEDDDHSYSIGICTKANAANTDEVAVIQTNKKSKKQFVIGRLNNVDVEGSDFYIRLTYNDGDRYKNACNKAQRTTVITILCNYENNDEKINLLEENNQRVDQDENNGTETSCAYYFELLTPYLCKVKQQNPTTTPVTVSTTTTTTTTSKTTASVSTSTTTSASSSTASTTKQASTQPTTNAINSNQTTTDSSKTKTGSKFGFFSITLFVLLGILFSYFVIGSLYNRFVNQQRGIEQLPNWQIWHSLGIRFQECGQFICRCGRKQSDIRAYDHINDQLSDDENLLNM